MIPNVFQRHCWKLLLITVTQLICLKSLVIEPKYYHYSSLLKTGSITPCYFIRVVTKRSKIRNCIHQIVQAYYGWAWCKYWIKMQIYYNTATKCHWGPGFIFSFDCKHKSLEECTETQKSWFFSLHDRSLKIK